jgi:NADH-quinone oxidoreductase subunit M
MLSAIIFLPLLGALIILAFGRSAPRSARTIALVVALADFALALAALGQFDASFAAREQVLFEGLLRADSPFQMREHLPWIYDMGISIHVGMDSLSLAMVLLATFWEFSAYLCS